MVDGCLVATIGNWVSSDHALLVLPEKYED